MLETKCIYGDCEYVEEQLNQYLNDGWNVLDMKTTLYDSTAGIRRDTTVYLIKTDQRRSGEGTYRIAGSRRWYDHQDGKYRDRKYQQGSGRRIGS